MFFFGQTERRSGEKESVDVDEERSSREGTSTNSSRDSQNGQLSLQTDSSIPTNKRKLENSQEIESEDNSYKKKRNEVQCKLERWKIGKDEIEVDLFCVQGWRDELCRCTKHRIEFILQAEETYEPPQDDEARELNINSS
ncbi:11704_t:CDS:2 [Acaulospora colombiana]|uniref:11704_t:CDS:1 n=1 Tax=Acaulospora colombiana TaxID=27376 RepID=A0ACA9LX17_9GLOM|nr:11704_t:CDS:2 [Acaulospora colombiana]